MYENDRSIKCKCGKYWGPAYRRIKKRCGRCRTLVDYRDGLSPEARARRAMKKAKIERDRVKSKTYKVGMEYKK
tara:strand:- start:17966 stop:18187 length:222 start_codon:yes stop_codon:yes gene_type:complete